MTATPTYLIELSRLANALQPVTTALSRAAEQAYRLSDTLARLNNEVNNKLLPAITKVSDQLQQKVSPSLTRLTDQVDNKLAPAIGKISSSMGGGMISSMVSFAAETIKVAAALKILTTATAAPKKEDNKVKEILGKIADFSKDMIEKGFIQIALRQQEDLKLKIAFGAKEGLVKAQELTDMAMETPFSRPQLVPAAVSMADLGMPAKDVKAMLYALGDISGGTEEKFKALNATFSKIQQEGNLTKDTFKELKAQGVNPLQLISATTGITMEKLEKRLASNRINTEMMAGAMKLAVAEGTRFHHSMEAQNATLDGQTNMLMDKFNNRLVQIVQYLVPAKNALLSLGIEFLDLSADVWLGIGAIAALAIPIAGASSSFGTLISVVSKSWGVLMANPVVLIIAGILALAAAIVYCYKHFEGFRAIVDGVWAGIKELGNTLLESVIARFELVGRVISNIGKIYELFKNKQYGEAVVVGLHLKADIEKLMTFDVSGVINKVKGAGSEAMKISRQHFKKEQNAKNHINYPDMSVDKGIFSSLFKDDEPPAKVPERASTINEGGNRGIIINIGKQIEKLEVHALTAKEGVEEMGNLVREEMRRVMLSLNAMPAD